jgi:hypothetical protein
VSKLTTLLACAVNCVAVLICACAATGEAQAQTSPQRRDPPPAAASPTPSTAAATTATGDPDLSITANVTARELRFEVVPNPRVEFPGRPRRDTVWEVERTNLPPQVQPGVTYRDLGIRLKITSVFADIERIVAEALGEIPASDDAPPKIDSNDNAQPPAASVQMTNGAAQPGDASPSMSLKQTSPASSSPIRPARGHRHSSAQARRGRR